MRKGRAWEWGLLVLCLTLLPPRGGDSAPPAVAAGKDLIQVKIQKLGLDPNSGQPVVFLADAGEERALPIWIGPCEANALNTELEGTKPPRPLTHDLTERIIQSLKGKIQRVIITRVKDGIYYATLVMEKEGSSVEVDARPSDCIVLARKSKAAIFVAKDLFQEMSVPLQERKRAEETYGITVQELTPPLALSFSFPASKGVLVADVREGSRAEKDGLQRGDILVEAAGKGIPDVQSFRTALSDSEAILKARVFRKGGFVSLNLNPK